MVPVLHVGTMAVGLIWGITMQRLHHTPPVRAGANCQDFVCSLFLYRAFSIYKVDGSSLGQRDRNKKFTTQE